MNNGELRVIYNRLNSIHQQWTLLLEIWKSSELSLCWFNLAVPFVQGSHRFPETTEDCLWGIHQLLNFLKAQCFNKIYSCSQEHTKWIYLFKTCAGTIYIGVVSYFKYCRQRKRIIWSLYFFCYLTMHLFTCAMPMFRDVWERFVLNLENEKIGSRNNYGEGTQHNYCLCVDEYLTLAKNRSGIVITPNNTGKKTAHCHNWNIVKNDRTTTKSAHPSPFRNSRWSAYL